MLSALYLLITLSMADDQDRLIIPPPPVDLIARLAKVPACVPPVQTPPFSPQLSLSEHGTRTSESAVLNGVNHIIDQFPKTKCEARVNE